MKRVSVLTVTYNHEKYIARALDSALMQVTSFEVEIVVGVDLSTDRTREIVERYAREHPGRIRTLLHDTRVGMHGNIQSTLAACDAEYVAVLEGDDYWTTTDKLQKQVEYLDGHPECVLCFTRARLVEETTGGDYDYGPGERQQSYGLEEILEDNFIPTATLLSRNKIITTWPSWVFELSLGDWAAHVLYAEKGRLGYLDETTAVYTRHPNGVWSRMTADDRLRTIVTMYQHLYTHLGPKYEAIIRILMRRAIAFGIWQKEKERLDTLVHELEQEQGRLWTRISTLCDERASLQHEVGHIAGERAALYQRLAVLGAQAEERQALYGERQQLFAQIAELGTQASERPAMYARIKELSDEVDRLRRPAIAETASDQAMEQLRALVNTAIAPGAKVAVVSKGNPQLLELGEGRVGRHFPADAQGNWSGHPADGRGAIAALEQARAAGAEYLVVPESEIWWLSHYEGLADRMAADAEPVRAAGVGVVCALQVTASAVSGAAQRAQAR